MRALLTLLATLSLCGATAAERETNFDIFNRAFAVLSVEWIDDFGIRWVTFSEMREKLRGVSLGVQRRIVDYTTHHGRQRNHVEGWNAQLGRCGFNRFLFNWDGNALPERVCWENLVPQKSCGAPFTCVSRYLLQDIPCVREMQNDLVVDFNVDRWRVSKIFHDELEGDPPSPVLEDQRTPNFDSCGHPRSLRGQQRLVCDVYGSSSCQSSVLGRNGSPSGEHESAKQQGQAKPVEHDLLFGRLCHPSLRTQVGLVGIAAVGLVFTGWWLVLERGKYRVGYSLLLLSALALIVALNLSRCPMGHEAAGYKHAYQQQSDPEQWVLQQAHGQNPLEELIGQLTELAPKREVRHG